MWHVDGSTQLRITEGSDPILKKNSFFFQLSLRHEDPEIIAHWAALVGGSVPSRGRPRRLLVFINPHGGRGQAPALFYNTILPLFSLAGIETKVRIESGGFGIHDKLHRKQALPPVCTYILVF